MECPWGKPKFSHQQRSMIHELPFVLTTRRWSRLFRQVRVNSVKWCCTAFHSVSILRRDLRSLEFVETSPWLWKPVELREIFTPEYSSLNLSAQPNRPLELHMFCRMHVQGAVFPEIFFNIPVAETSGSSESVPRFLTWSKNLERSKALAVTWMSAEKFELPS